MHFATECVLLVTAGRHCCWVSGSSLGNPGGSVVLNIAVQREGGDDIALLEEKRNG